MKLIIDESAQVSAELILIFGGIICIALVALVFYDNYVHGFNSTAFNTSNNTSQVSSTIQSIQNLNSLF
ncbi:MAG: class III signal peptide-containing protein [Methanobacterium sp.]